MEKKLKLYYYKKEQRYKIRGEEKVNWTKEQEDAIYKKDNNILVAAAARKWKNSRACRTYNSKNFKR